MDDWLTFQQVCERLEVSPMTLRRLILTRAIQYSRKTPRGAYRFKPEWLETYQIAQTVKPVTTPPVMA